MISEFFPSGSGLVKYKVSVHGASSFSVKVNLVDRDGRSVATAGEESGVLKVADVKLWWPYLMHENPGYLYSLEVRRQKEGPGGGGDVHNKVNGRGGIKGPCFCFYPFILSFHCH